MFILIAIDLVCMNLMVPIPRRGKKWNIRKKKSTTTTTTHYENHLNSIYWSKIKIIFMLYYIWYIILNRLFYCDTRINWNIFASIINPSFYTMLYACSEMPFFPSKQLKWNHEYVFFTTNQRTIEIFQLENLRNRPLLPLTVWFCFKLQNFSDKKKYPTKRNQKSIKKTIRLKSNEKKKLCKILVLINLPDQIEWLRSSHIKNYSLHMY